MPVLLLVLALFCGGSGAGQAFAVEPDAALHAKYLELRSTLYTNQFQRPLHLDSAESANDLKGEIHAVVDHPFATVEAALNNPTHWCDVLILHVYVKYCHVSPRATGATLTVNLSNKIGEPLADSYQARFDYHRVVSTPGYFAVHLQAADGPLGTRDYRIWLEAIPLEDGRTFLHFTYAYAFGTVGRLAMQGYLATAGRNKVGFTLTGQQPNGQPAYIQGVRGVVERNTMRYYLAIEAYLAALNAPPADQLEQRLRHWFDGTSQYARQLHELERQDYLEMKRREYERQQGDERRASGADLAEGIPAHG